MKKKKVRKSHWTRVLKDTRKIWSMHFPARKECLNNAKVKTEGFEKWKCAHCANLFAKSEVQVDHVIPIGNTIPQTIEEYFVACELLHCDVSGLQVLCSRCHKIKTKVEIVDKAREKYIATIGSHVAPTTVLKDLDASVLRSMAKAIQGMNTADPCVVKRAEKKFDAIAKKYL